MSSLQEATDIIAIVFMGLITISLIVSVISLVVIKNKVKRLRYKVWGKLSLLRNLSLFGRNLTKMFR